MVWPRARYSITITPHESQNIVVITLPSEGVILNFIVVGCRHPFCLTEKKDTISWHVVCSLLLHNKFPRFVYEFQMRIHKNRITARTFKRNQFSKRLAISIVLNRLITFTTYPHISCTISSAICLHSGETKFLYNIQPLNAAACNLFSWSTLVYINTYNLRLPKSYLYFTLIQKPSVSP